MAHEAVVSNDTESLSAEMTLSQYSCYEQPPPVCVRERGGGKEGESERERGGGGRWRGRERQKGDSLVHFSLYIAGAIHRVEIKGGVLVLWVGSVVTMVEDDSEEVAD